ncbi:heme biosynthesis HemY N-terminal domain-containing protein [Pseudoxanthomonas sp. JBR18]|uniref:heme biosynthesis HemY N-terminal domain-containing protein n=1 Tax=Pseudoxanthomonas sp. JBR18 TaxID=2969308 RepID=UPI00230505CA|nr:heme biosynthesis HemY N-terminal domain-containing protein [Pseudoxanthomonas sp. JBR18]WCE06100.1 heme biosynthesis HemY N-terminal domain-containing protein [Pseudoxanthomonas sp. JBR18]
MKTLRLAIVLLVLVAIGVIGAQWLAREDIRDWGEVFVRVGGYDITATVPGAILALVAAALLLWIVWSLLALPFRTWGRHRRKRARAQLIEGLEALHHGHWQRAEKSLDRAAQDAEVGAIARAGAVRGAQAREDPAATERHLQALAERNPTSHALLVAEDALRGAQPAQALVALDAPAAQPLPPRGLYLRAQALSEIGRAGDAWGLLGPLRQQRALAPEAQARFERDLAARTLEQAGDANVLAERWEALPKPLRVEPAVVAAYAARAAVLHWDDAATHALEHALDSRWDEGLIALYGKLPVGKLDSRRASAQRWIQTHSDSPALLLTLARLARQQGQWPQAQDFLHRALAQGAGADAWEELGDGYAADGQDLLARRSYANALAASRGEVATALPERDLRQQIHDHAVGEERDEHGMPRLRN